MRFVATFAAAALASMPFAMASTPTRDVPKGLQSPSSIPQIGAISSAGCYSSKANMTAVDLDRLRLSSGGCREACDKKGFTVMALQGSTCSCGYAMPPTVDHVKDDKCNYPCSGFGDEACGAVGDEKYYSIFNLGKDIDPPIYGKGSDAGDDKASTSGSPSSTTMTETSMATPTSAPTGASTTGSTTPSGTGPNNAATSTGDPDNGSAAFNYGGIISTLVAGLAFALV